MAGTEQGGKADKHGDSHNRFDRRALAVFKSNFRSGRFQNKTRDQTEFPQFSVKRPFQNEASLTPTDHEPGQWFAAWAGPWFALFRSSAFCRPSNNGDRTRERARVFSSDGVTGVCSDQGRIMSPVALVHAAPAWMDDVLADSFPASDPPSWTPGMARPAPIVHAGQEVSLMLQTGDLVPHFTVTTFCGESFDYSDIWQRKNLVLVLLPHADSAASAKFVDQLTVKMSELTGDDSACVITRDSVSGVPSPGIVVADRWGEIHHVAEGKTVDDLPGPDDLIEWLRYVQHQCPECEGEAR